MLKIKWVSSKQEIQQVRQLFLEYAGLLGFDLHFQDFKNEVSGLPGDYAPPKGGLMLAVKERQVAGCVALREIGGRICEMKRLYVRPEFRGQGIGRRLALTIIGEARKRGYAQMRLDTVPSMKEATSLYRSLGFKEIEPYRYNPVRGALFMELSLED